MSPYPRADAPGAPDGINAGQEGSLHIIPQTRFVIPLTPEAAPWVATPAALFIFGPGKPTELLPFRLRILQWTEQASPVVRARLKEGPP